MNQALPFCLLSKPNHTMHLCISLMCTFSICLIHMSQEGTSCTLIYLIFLMNYEFGTPTPCMSIKEEKETELTIQGKRVFLKILAQGKFFLNCFQYKWAIYSKYKGKTLELGCVLARKKYVQRRTILLKHQGISLFFLEELWQGIASLNIIFRYAKFKAFNYRYHYLTK